MQTSNNRGGAKPNMLPAFEPLGIDCYGRRKFGMYEVGTCGTLARRVELPEWLSQAFAGAPMSNLRMPKEEIGESRGHIFISPPAKLFGCPAVGVDLEVHQLLQSSSDIRQVRFYVYGTGYRLFEVWSISRSDFLAKAKRVQTKPSFMPQMMVAITALDGVRGLSVH